MHLRVSVQARRETLAHRARGWVRPRSVPHLLQAVACHSVQLRQLAVAAAMAQVASFAAASTKTLQQLDRRFRRLRALQQRLVLPPLTHFTTCGRRFNLPLRAKTARPCCRQLPQRTLEYLAGFFDGDGCVSSAPRGANSRLYVGQCVPGSEVLLLFRSAFGGSIRSYGRTMSMHRPHLTWLVCGERARHAASVLGPATSCKQSQLLVASDWPRCYEAQAHAAAQLKKLKHVPPQSALCRSWAYLAGFFDAEGCISLRFPRSLELIVPQKIPNILYAIREFLAAEGIACRVATGKNCARLTICATEASKQVLVRLLSAGLRVKRQAARTELSVSRDTFHLTRKDLANNVGYQNRYQRLTAEGLERSRSIARLTCKLQVATDALRPALQGELQQLKVDHAWNCALERCASIRSDIRAHLSHEIMRNTRTRSGCGVATEPQALDAGTMHSS